MSVHFLSDQGWHSLGQTTGFIFEQRLPPFLSSAEIRYGIQNMSLSLTPTPSHITRQGRQLSCCIVTMIYAQTSRHTLSLSLSLRVYALVVAGLLVETNTCTFLDQNRGHKHTKPAHNIICRQFKMHKKQQAAIQPMLSFGELAFHKTPALTFDPATTLKQVCYFLPLHLRLS